MSDRKKSCALCLRPFGRGRTTARVMCTVVRGGEDYRMTWFHASCMARQPQLAVLEAIGPMLARQRAEGRRAKRTCAAEHTNA